MKTGLILGLLIASIFQAVPKQANKPQPNQNDSKNVSEQSKQAATGGTENVSPPGPSSKKKESGANGEAKQPGWCERLIAPVISDWPVLAVAIWGILVARSTLLAIQKQADEIAGQRVVMDGQLAQMKAASEQTDKLIEQAKGQADAARQAVEIVISKERANISIEVFDLGLSSPHGLQAVRYEIRIAGLTDARIVESQANAGISESKIELPNYIPLNIRMANLPSVNYSDGYPKAGKFGHVPPYLQAH